MDLDFSLKNPSRILPPDLDPDRRALADILEARRLADDLMRLGYSPASPGPAGRGAGPGGRTGL